jgi:LemA protein
MSKTKIGIGAFVALCVIIVLTKINNIPVLDENVKSKWAQVENQYKRRYDLIPNLVNTVKGYAKHEKETLMGVIEARSKVGQINIDANSISNPQMMQAFSQAQGSLTSALSKLMLVVERYPDLKANKNFLALQSQLEGTENRIAVARKDYIASVKKYNIELRSFPSNIVASIFHPEAEIMPNFNIPQQEKVNPQVKF